MKGKQGFGITLFIIVGLLILLGVFLSLQFLDVGASVPTLSTTDSMAVRSFISACITDVSTQGLEKLGKQGGVLVQPANSHSASFGFVAYGYEGGKNTLVPTTTIQQQLGTYISNNLPKCLNDFDTFKKQGIAVKAKHITSSVLLTMKDVLVKVDYPLRVKQGEQALTLEAFQVHVPIRLLHLHTISNTIMDGLVKKPGFVDLTHLGKQDVTSTLLTQKNGDQLLVLDDKEYTLVVAMEGVDI